MPVTIHRVLLVDDQPIIHEAIKKMLAGEPDISLDYCQHPTEAVKTAENTRPTVILQDLLMPELSGLDLVRYFRASSLTRDIPLVVLSSKDDPAIKAEAFGNGANDYLVKLPDRLELLARIRYHSRAYRLLLERNDAMQQNQLLLESAGEGIFGLDTEGRTTFVNPAASKMLGFSPEELLGRVQHKITHYAKPDGTPNPAEECPICQALCSGRTFHNDREVFWRRNGTPFPVDYIARPIMQDKHVTGCVVTFRDITVRKQEQLTLLDAKEAAEQANYSKSRFLANMSHELRTPLNAIIGYSEILEEELDEEGMGSLTPDLQKIRSAGKHLLGLISDILDISKIEAGKMDAYLETSDVAEILNDVISTAHPLALKKNNELVANLDDNLGEIHTDITKLQQMLLNLLSNAAKFTKQGKITLHASRHSDEQGEWITVSVCDTGIGMTAEQQSKIFDPFIQADVSTTREYGGTGLGLAISKKFADMLGGSLCVTSTFGKGSCFILNLPADCAAEHIQRHQVSHEDVPRPGHGNIVLLVSSDFDLVAAVQDLLKQQHYLVAVAHNNNDALALADKLRPDMIVLDQAIDGSVQALLNELQNSLVFGDIPIITLGIAQTALTTRKPIDYLAKPLVFEQLHGCLKKYQVNHEAPLVMVIDDAYDNRVVTSLLLRRAGWRVFSCENGRVGLAQLIERKPAVIILDLKMPDMDGFEFLTHVRKDESWFHVPVVIFTASQLSEEDSLRLKGQVAEIVIKGSPQAYHQLVDKVALLVNS